MKQEGGHPSYFFEEEPPLDGAASRVADDPELRALIRIYIAHRGMWESGWWLGPTVSVARSEDDVRRYLEVFDAFLASIMRGTG